MPYAENNGVRIYYEVMGTDGPPLVLQHGFTQTLETWKREGYVEKLESEYRLILIDGRGHGKSDKPHDPEAYKYSTRTVDVVAVLDDLGFEKASYWGYSMGPGIGFGLLWQSPERIDTFVFGAGTPYASSTTGGIVSMFANGTEAFLEFITKSLAAVGKELAEGRRKEILALDIEALVASTRRPEESEQMIDALKPLVRPAFSYAGDLDDGYDLMARLPEANPRIEFATLPGLDHMGTWNSSGVVVPVVLEFLRRQG